MNEAKQLYTTQAQKLHTNEAKQLYTTQAQNCT